MYFCNTGISPSVSHPVWSWEVILPALLTWSHSIPHLYISIGCIYTLIFFLYVFLNPVNPQSNSKCWDAFWCGTGSMKEHGDVNFDVPWEGHWGRLGRSSSIPSHECSGQPGGCVHQGPQPLSPAQPLGRGPLGVLCKSPFCPLCQAASLQSEQRNFSLLFFHVSRNLPCPEFRLWLFFLAFL